MWYPGIWDGRKWRQIEEMGGKILSTRANTVLALIRLKMDQTGPTMDQKWLKIKVFVPNILFCK